jgi:hypothetical protein
MLFEFGPGGHPRDEFFPLVGRELPGRIGRRHLFRRIVARDPPDELARLGIARDDGSRAGSRLRVDSFPPVEAQIRLARGLVRPMAGEALVGQDRPDVAAEIERRRIGVKRRGKRDHAHDEGPRAKCASPIPHDKTHDRICPIHFVTEPAALVSSA